MVADISTTLGFSLHVSSTDGSDSPSPSRPDMQSINGDGKVLLRRLNHHPQPQQVAAINNYLQHQPLSYPQHQPPQPQQAAALKCPRCDSLNTKFCYYNNYNLSQPRHFCKNCRRYWTKGGVLRNVPVGGGCRKSKKSSKPKSPPSLHTTSPTTTANASISSGGNNYLSQTRDLGLNSSHSSRHSSGESCSNATLFHIPDMDNLETNTLFSDEIGNFMRIDNNSNNSNNSNDNINNIHDNSNNNSTVSGAVTAEAASFTEYLRNQEWEMGKIICGVQEDKIERSTAVDLVDVDQTVRIEDFLQNRGISALDWNPTADNNQGLFDNSTVDHHDYWGQSTTTVDHHDPQWSDSTTGHLPLFLP